MDDISNEAFIDLVAEYRRREFSEFKSTITQYRQYILIVSKVEENTLAWGKSVGLVDKITTSTVDLSPQETLWSNYFRDHSFPSSEEQRNLADALSIATGIDMLRFIRVIDQRKDRFPAHIVIVPTGSSNSHNYRIGEPVISLVNGTNFYKKSGESGNNITTNIKELRMPTKVEIEYIVTFVMYKLGVATEHLLCELDIF